MCGRYALTCDTETLYDVFAPDVPSAQRTVYGGDILTPRYNIPPTATVPIFRRTADEGRQLAAAVWGLIPSWATDRSMGGRMFNARSETAAAKPAFRRAFARRRALVPASGYFEWKALPGNTSRPVKQPFYISPADGSLLAFAGLWESWRDADGNRMMSMAIVTAPARGALAEVHDRMPVILPAADYPAWLDPDCVTGDLQLLAAGPPEDLLAELELRPVGCEVGNVGDDYPELLHKQKTGPVALF